MFLIHLFYERWWILLALFIVLSLSIGSFLNVVIYRLPQGKSIAFPGSHCTFCGHNLTPLDLMPVLSFIYLRRKCRYCGEKISFRYPLIEILTAICFFMIYIQYDWSIETLKGCILTSILIVTAFIDMDTGLIPDVITYPGMLAGLLLSYFTIGFLPSLYGLLSSAAAYGIIVLLSRGGMGGGDVKLAGVIGAFTGLEGAFLTFTLSSLLGGLWAVFLLIRGEAKMKTEVRFGPFLALAGFAAYIGGKDILYYYFSLFY